MFSVRKPEFVRALLVGMGLLVLAAAMVGCGGEDEPKIDANGCEVVERPAAKSVALAIPTNVLDPKVVHLVKFETNCGAFTIKLDARNNPRTASSFAFLTEEGVYDDTWFHRIVEGFVVQGGDPSGDGTGTVGYSISEPPTGDYRIGTVAMAKGGGEPSGTSSSQFYIVIGEDGTDLPPDYAIAGEVSAGLDVVKKIAGYAPEPGVSDTGPTGVAVVESATLQSNP